MSNFGRGQYEEYFCEIILNLDQWFRRGFNLKIFLFLAPVAIFNVTICAILVEGKEEHFCEIILNLPDQCFGRKYNLMIFLYLALQVAILFSKVEPFVQSRSLKSTKSIPGEKCVCPSITFKSDLCL